VVELQREELQALLGAYALDAVDPDERDQIERYLDAEPRARAEVESFREAASMLAMSGADAPSGIWDRIVGEIDGEERDLGQSAVVPPELNIAAGRDAVAPISDLEQARDSRRRTVALRWVGVAGAVAATLIAVLSIQVIRENDRIDRLDAAMASDAVQRGAETAASAPGSRTVSLASDSGAEVASIVLRPSGTGYFVSKGLQVAPAGQVYQLWALVGDPKQPEAISAGVLGRDPRVASFRFAGPVNGFAVTMEKAPGVISSLQKPEATGLVPA
jgi:Anti-sigma-K factor rskA